MPSKRKVELNERALRGLPYYPPWRDLAIEINGKKEPEILRIVSNHLFRFHPAFTDLEQRRAKECLELVLKDIYPSFVVMERLKGGK